LNEYVERAEILAVITAKVDRNGRLYLRKYRGKTARILVLRDDPQSPRAVFEARRKL